MGFNVTDSDINAVIQQFMGFLQHAVRLAYSGHHTNVNLELSPSRTPYQVKKVLCSVTSVNHIKFTRLLRLKHLVDFTESFENENQLRALP